MDSIAACLATSGTSKSGRPIERLIGSFIFAARSKTLRMPEASTPSARLETKLRGIEHQARRHKGTKARSGEEAERDQGGLMPCSLFTLRAFVPPCLRASPWTYFF